MKFYITTPRSSIVISVTSASNSHCKNNWTFSNCKIVNLFGLGHNDAVGTEKATVQKCTQVFSAVGNAANTCSVFAGDDGLLKFGE